MLEYRKATLADLPRIQQVYQEAIEYMLIAGIDQWDDFYPNEETLRHDIQRDEMYVGTIQENIAVVFTLNAEQDPQYAKGRWQYPERPAVVHRLCVNYHYRGFGIGRLAMQQAEELLQAQGFASVRLDAFPKNVPAIKLYEGMGYTKVGEVHFRKGLFYLYEKKL